MASDQHLRYGLVVPPLDVLDVLREQKRAVREGRRSAPPEVVFSISSAFPSSAAASLSENRFPRVFPLGREEPLELDAVNHISTVILANCSASGLININNFSVNCPDIALHNLDFEAFYYLQFKRSLGNHSAITARVQGVLGGDREAMILSGYAGDEFQQSISRISRGRYRVVIGPEANEGGHVQVSSDWRANCRVESFGGGIANIACSAGGIDEDPGELSISAFMTQDFSVLRSDIGPFTDPNEQRKNEIRERLLRGKQRYRPPDLE